MHPGYVVAIAMAVGIVVVGSWQDSRHTRRMRLLAQAAGLGYQQELTIEAGMALIGGARLAHEEHHAHAFADLLQGSRRGLKVFVLKHAYDQRRDSRVVETVFGISAGERGLNLSPNRPNTRLDLEGFRLESVSSLLLFYRPGFVVPPEQLLLYLDKLLDVVEPWVV